MPDIFDADDLQKKHPSPPSSSHEHPVSAPPPTQTPPPQHNVEQPSAPEPLVSPSQASIPHSEAHFHALASFCQHPTGIHFTTQEKDEEIFLFLRAHFATNLSWVFLTVFFAFLPIILAITIPQISPQNLFSFIPSSYITILFSFYYLIIFAYAFINFITWFYNIFLVTNKRIIDIDFSNIVFHQVAATKKELIQDVRYDQVGFIPSLLDFGHIFISTASEVPIFEAMNVPHPKNAVYLIQKLIGKVA